MLLLNLVPYPLSPMAEALVDAALLVVLSTPILYLWVIRPFIVARDDADRLAQRDHLTLVSNRLYLVKHLERCSGICSRRKTHAALLFIDLDGFKSVNDQHGHAAGDALLIEVAARMRAVARQEDVIFRLGGDEFIVLICPLDGDAAQATGIARKVGEKFRLALREPFRFDGTPLAIDSSIGIRMMSGGKTEPEAVIRQADSAMYRAKQGGGGRVVVFSE
jgi:diguanylate cyclase (GGDEF)-like protein